MKFQSHWPKGLEGDSIKANYLHFSIFSSSSHFVYGSGTVFCYFGRRSPKQHSYEV